VGAGAGVNLPHDSESRGVRIVPDNPGGVGVGSIGWGFGNGIRAEIEGNYRENEIDKLTSKADLASPASPRARATSAPTA
jgi:hypothetical protein